MTNLIQIYSIFGSSELQHMVQILVYEEKKEEKRVFVGQFSKYNVLPVATVFPWTKPCSFSCLNLTKP